MVEEQYLLFFKATDLTGSDEELIRGYFKVPVEKAQDNNYRISFTNLADQERVLQKKFHTLPLSNGELHITVTRALVSRQPSISKPQPPPKPKTEVMEKKFHLTTFYQQFLRDSPEASKTLQKEVSSIGCTMEMDWEKEELVLKRVQRVGIGGKKKWEQQADAVFMSIMAKYSSHHVTDPKLTKHLLQNKSLTRDDFKVYNHNGGVVLVGKAEDLKTRIQALQQSVTSRKVLQIEEMKYQLVEMDFRQEMLEHHPAVEINRSSGTIILEGPETGVQRGAARLEQWIQKIQRKSLVLPPVVIEFLSCSGILQKYRDEFQYSLRSPVSIEIQSEVILSSLCTDAMDEAEDTLLKDLTVVMITVQRSLVDLETLKDSLLKAMREANSDGPQVDVNFIPGLSAPATTDVLLVGNYKTVTKLQEMVQEHKKNLISSQEVVPLSTPNLLDCFKEFKQLIGLDSKNTTLSTTRFPNPSVLIAGPPSEVKEVKERLTSTLEKVECATLSLDGLGAQRYFEGNGRISKELIETSCQVMIKEQQDVPQAEPEGKISTAPKLREKSKSDPQEPSFWKDHNRSIRRGSLNIKVASLKKTHLRIKLGSLEDEQVGVLVAPLLGKKLSLTEIGCRLLDKAGNDLNVMLESVLSTTFPNPGDIVQVQGPPSMNCSKIIFIKCLPWDRKNSKAQQALKHGLHQCLTTCVDEAWTSVSFPIIGPGWALGYPLGVSIKALTDTIRQFKSFGSLTDINIILKPGDANSKESYAKIHKHLSSFWNKRPEGSFRSLTTDLDDIIVSLNGGVELELVFGDITDERTDAVVNSTNFSNFDYEGVCKHILARAGSKVAQELRSAPVQPGQIFASQPGKFPCKAILHVCGEMKPDVIQKLSGDIIDYCESQKYKSVAMPALCAGVGGVPPDVVARAILRGIRVVTSTRTLAFTTKIRIILFKIDVFLAFKEMVNRVFSLDSRTGDAFQQDSGGLPHSDQSALPWFMDGAPSSTPPKCHNSKFLLLGFSKESVENATKQLKEMFEAQCDSQSFTAQEMSNLTLDDEKSLDDLIDVHGLCMTRDTSGGLTVRGLKDGINEAKTIIQSSNHKQLMILIRNQKENELYGQVAWCIMGNDGNWVRLPKTANYNLEESNLDDGIVDADGNVWMPNLNTMTAMRPLSGKTQLLKRLDIEPDFSFPLDWDNMAKGESPKMVPLSSSSVEYKRVESAIHQTVVVKILKIQRMQNIRLRQAYEVRKKMLSSKNQLDGGANEKLLFHGTGSENIQAIITNGFDWRYAGQNATSYGIGTYFALKANYSANPKYSRPAADGTQSMFMVRVLTGVPVIGHVDMKVLPPRDPKRPQDLFDSAVDRLDEPQIYVVFQDNQAYPDYLITFRYA